MKFVSRIGINSNPDRVADLDINYVVFIHVHPSLESVQVCYPHHLSTSKISRRNHAFTQFVI